MTYEALYDLERREMLDVPVIGVAIDEMSIDDLRARARESVEEEEESVDDAVFDSLAKRLSYIQGDYKDPKTFEAVESALGGAKTPVFYLEIPPSLFSMVVNGLHDAGLTEGARVVIEKPFGHDLDRRWRSTPSSASCSTRTRSTGSTITSARSR